MWLNTSFSEWFLGSLLQGKLKQWSLQCKFSVLNNPNWHLSVCLSLSWVWFCLMQDCLKILQICLLWNPHIPISKSDTVAALVKLKKVGTAGFILHSKGRWFDWFLLFYNELWSKGEWIVEFKELTVLYH